MLGYMAGSKVLGNVRFDNFGGEQRLRFGNFVGNDGRERIGIARAGLAHPVIENQSLRKSLRGRKRWAEDERLVTVPTRN
jgi:hypothetical protein